MSRFKPGDRVRRIKDPVLGLIPLNSEWIVGATELYKNFISLKEIDGLYFDSNFELIEEKEMPKYLLIYMDNQEVISPNKDGNFTFSSIDQIAKWFEDYGEEDFEEYKVYEAKEVKLKQKIILEVEK